MLMGVYIVQYCINVFMYFFIMWFLVYLVQVCGMLILKVGIVVLIFVVCGFLGGILGGIIFDVLFCCGVLLLVVCKVFIVLGMLFFMIMVICNYVDVQVIVVVVMVLLFFGKGFGVLGWVVNLDMVFKQIVGLLGVLMNMFGNLLSIIMFIVIGYIVNIMGLFNGVLVYVGIYVVVVIFCYLFMVGEIKCVEFKLL